MPAAQPMGLARPAAWQQRAVAESFRTLTPCSPPACEKECFWQPCRYALPGARPTWRQIWL